MFLFPNAYLLQQDDKQPQCDCWNQKKIFETILLGLLLTWHVSKKTCFNSIITPDCFQLSIKMG